VGGWGGGGGVGGGGGADDQRNDFHWLLVISARRVMCQIGAAHVGSSCGHGHAHCQTGLK